MTSYSGLFFLWCVCGHLSLAAEAKREEKERERPEEENWEMKRRGRNGCIWSTIHLLFSLNLEIDSYPELASLFLSFSFSQFEQTQTVCPCLAFGCVFLCSIARSKQFSCAQHFTPQSSVKAFVWSGCVTIACFACYPTLTTLTRESCVKIQAALFNPGKHTFKVSIYEWAKSMTCSWESQLLSFSFFFFLCYFFFPARKLTRHPRKETWTLHKSKEGPPTPPIQGIEKSRPVTQLYWSFLASLSLSRSLFLNFQSGNERPKMMKQRERGREVHWKLLCCWAE